MSVLDSVFERAVIVFVALQTEEIIIPAPDLKTTE